MSTNKEFWRGVAENSRFIITIENIKEYWSKNIGALSHNLLFRFLKYGKKGVPVMLIELSLLFSPQWEDKKENLFDFLSHSKTKAHSYEWNYSILSKPTQSADKVNATANWENIVNRFPAFQYNNKLKHTN